MSDCPACAEAALAESHEFAAECNGCAARALARTTLRHGHRGYRLRVGCEQFGLQPKDVHAAWARDAINTEEPKT
jgi:hypothetical protein